MFDSFSDLKKEYYAFSVLCDSHKLPSTVEIENKLNNMIVGKYIIYHNYKLLIKEMINGFIYKIQMIIGMF